MPPWMMVEFWLENEDRSDADPPRESAGRRLCVGMPSTTYGIRHVMKMADCCVSVLSRQAYAT